MTTNKITISSVKQKGDTMECMKCEECLKEKCDIYRSEKLSVAWNELLDTIGKDFGLYKLFDWLTKFIK